ncbi:MAG: HlyD family efflux transporter periplasmic adaptor subunit [bacterium]|nr:HlyD family efflux transporter periplasmic adaptor subunit [bacterium]
MKNNLFRKEALSRLQSTDQSEEAVSLIPRRLWLFLFAVLLLTVAILIWAFLGRVPVSVNGYGIFYFSGRMSEVTADQAGILNDIFVRDGQVVQKGQLLALVKGVSVKRLGAISEKYSEIRAPHDGIVLGVSVYPINQVSAGQMLMLLSPLGINKRDLKGIAFVSSIDGKLVKKDMKAQIEVSTVTVEEHGLMKANVSAVSVLPASKEEVSSLIKINKIVEFIESRIPVAPIYVAINPVLSNLNTASGYQWTLDEPNYEIEQGTLFKVKIIVEEKRPIDYFIPFFKNIW